LSRFRPRRIVAVASLACIACISAPSTQGAKRSSKEPAAPREVTLTGEIVDCTDFIMSGKRGPERRLTAAKNIDSGMPACFVANPKDGVYLLLTTRGQARTHFQPTPNFLGANLRIKGIVYDQGGIQALKIDTIMTLPSSKRARRPPEDPSKPKID
jgi:hypothetical protein